MTATRKKREKLKLQVSLVLLGEHCLTRQLATNSCMCCRVALRTQVWNCQDVGSRPFGALGQIRKTVCSDPNLAHVLEQRYWLCSGMRGRGVILLSEAFKQLCNLGILLAIPFAHLQAHLSALNWGNDAKQLCRKFAKRQVLIESAETN